MIDFSALTQCKLCPQLGTNHVPGWGKLYKPAIFVIGQSPGATEVKEGKPFVGQSGKLLDGLLTELGLARDECYITNVVKCRPPNNRSSLPEEKATCYKAWLQGELKALNPALVLLLGRDAHECLLPARFAFGHLSVVRTAKRSFITSYHPAYWLRRKIINEWMQLANPLREELAYWSQHEVHSS